MIEPLPNKPIKRLDKRAVNSSRASAVEAAAVAAGARSATAGTGSAAAAAEALVDAAPAGAAAVALTATTTTAAAAGCSPDPAAASALCTVGDGELALGLLSPLRPLKLEPNRATRLALDLEVAAAELLAPTCKEETFKSLLKPGINSVNASCLCCSVLLPEGAYLPRTTSLFPLPRRADGLLEGKGEPLSAAASAAESRRQPQQHAG